MAEIEKGGIIASEEVEAPLDLAHNLDQAIVALEKLRRAAINSGEAMRGATSTTEVKNLIAALQQEQAELKKVNQQLQEQIRTMGKQSRTTANATREAKNFQKGIIDMLKDVRIGGVSVGQVLDKLEKANSRVFTSISQGYNKATISAKLFGNAARTALTLTGIGIVIALLVTLAANWDNIAKAIGLATDEQKKFFEKAKKSADEYSNELEHQLALMKAMGTEEKILNEARIAGTRELLRQQEIALEAAENAFKEQVKIDRLTGGWSGDIEGARTAYNETTQAIKKTRDELAILLATQTRLGVEEGDENLKRMMEAAKKAAADRKKAEEQRLQDLLKARDFRLQIYEDGLKMEHAAYLKEQAKREEAREKELGILKRFNDRIADETKRRSKDEENARKKREEDSEREIARRQEVAFTALNITTDVLNTIDMAVSQRAQARMDRLQVEEDRLTEHYNKLITLAGDNLAQRSQLENEYEAKRAEIERKRRVELRRTAMQEKANAMFSIIINTARAVVELLAKPALAVAAGIIGAAQLAVVSSQKLPSYARGTGYHKGGLARVGEEGPELYFNPYTGKGGITPGKETVMNLEPGTVVVPNKQTMRALATAGLESHNHIPIGRKGDMIGLYFRELNTTIKNKRGVEVNITEQGLRMAFNHAETKINLLKGLYK